MYSEPPTTQNPAILADKAELIVSESKSNKNNAIFVVRAECCVLEYYQIVHIRYGN